MAPRDSHPNDLDFSDFDKDTTGNEDLIPNAGKVTIGKFLKPSQLSFELLDSLNC